MRLPVTQLDAGGHTRWHGAGCRAGLQGAAALDGDPVGRQGGRGVGGEEEGAANGDAARNVHSARQQHPLAGGDGQAAGKVRLPARWHQNCERPRLRIIRGLAGGRIGSQA